MTQEYPSDLVSIITPSYNSEKFISETIESVINQTYPNWEMIIIDDQSTDKSCDIVEKYSADDPRIRLIKSEVNQGPALSRNTGIKESRGRYIAFLDSDDIWAKKKLELQIENLNRSEHSISFTSYECIDENSQPLNRIIKAKPAISYSDMLNYNHIGCLTAVYDTKKTGKVYFENIGHEDYILWLSLIRQGHKAEGIDSILARYRIRGGSVSNNKLKMTKYQWNIYRNIEKLNLLKASYHFSRYAFNGIKKIIST